MSCLGTLLGPCALPRYLAPSLMPKRCIRRSSAWSKNSLIASFGLSFSSRSGAFQSVRESSSS
eukprot:4478945-Pyramimonas_sp.AAC.1